MSDLHGHLPDLPDADVVLIGGDICPRADPFTQSRWLDTQFRVWLEGIRGQTVAVAGNHDFVFEQTPHLVPRLPWTYLQDTGKEIEGLKVYGSPWQPRFHDWAFNLDEEALKKKWAQIPDDTTVLLLHGPPFGYGDRIVRKEKDRSIREHVGSPSLWDRILAIRPKLVVFGHIHPDRGVYQHEEITLVNASLVNNRYEPVHDPIVLNLE